MRRFMFLVAAVLLMTSALAADVAPAGPADTIWVEEASGTFSAPMQEPEVVTSVDSITVEGATATWGGTLLEP